VIASSLQAPVAELLAAAGFSGLHSVEPLRGGGNNRVYCIDAGGRTALLKAYFQHPDDPRDRLGAEFAFSTFAWSHGLRALPQPLACDPRHHLALYEYVEGRKLRPQEVTAKTVDEAIDFFCDINRHAHLPEAERLAQASEACFSVAEHLRCVERRVQRLLGLENHSVAAQEASCFIQGDLCEAWRQTAAAVRQQASLCRGNIDWELSQADRCLSPSDFGFHNALRAGDERLRFLDFEYAGWDDAAKVVWDCFCERAVPVPLHFYDDVVGRVAAVSGGSSLPQRIGLLLPVYQLKWCCILLNDFLPLGCRRRSFAGGTAAQEEQKARQLQKARQALQNLVRPAHARSA